MKTRPETIINQVQASNGVVLSPAAAEVMAAELASYLARGEAFAALLQFDDEPSHFSKVLAAKQDEEA